MQVQDAHDANPTNNATETTSQVVVFRDGFESADTNVSSLLLEPFETPVIAGDMLSLQWQAPGAKLIDILVVASPSGAGLGDTTLRLERLNVGSRIWVRLVTKDDGGAEYASEWLLAIIDSGPRLVVLESVQGGAGDAPFTYAAHLSLPSGAELQLPLTVCSPSYRVWSAAPLTLEPATARD